MPNLSSSKQVLSHWVDRIYELYWTNFKPWNLKPRPQQPTIAPTYLFLGLWHPLVTWWYRFTGGLFDPHSYDDPTVCTNKDDEWNEILEKHDGHPIDVLQRWVVPQNLLAEFRGRGHVKVRVCPSRHGGGNTDHKGKQPYHWYNNKRLHLGHFSSKWIDDGDVSVDANGDEGQRAEEHSDGLKECDHGTHRLPERPFIEDQVSDESERDAEDSHEDVTESEADNEEVHHRPHSPGPKHNVTNCAVTAHRQENGKWVCSDDNSLDISRNFKRFVHKTVSIVVGHIANNRTVG